jgi:hypothetical protein
VTFQKGSILAGEHGAVSQGLSLPEAQD